MEHTALGLVPHACPPARRASAYLVKGKPPTLSIHILNPSKLMPEELWFWHRIQTLPLGGRACCVCPGCPNPSFTIGSKVGSFSLGCLS